MLAPVFFQVWIGGDFTAAAAPIAQILFIGAWINGLAFVLYEMLQSQGRPDITGKFHAAELLPFTAVLWAGTAWFGLAGAATAWTLRCAVDAICLSGAARIAARDLAPAAAPLLLIIGASVLSHLLPTAALWPVLVAALLVGVAAAGVGLVLAEDLRDLVRSLLRRLGPVARPIQPRLD